MLSILLLGIFLYQVAGIFVAFKIQQQGIRKEIKRQIKLGVPAGELHYLTITAANYRELAWHNHKEFMYRGVMYDVVHKKINHATSVTFQCVSDTQETILFANLEQQVDQTTDARHHGKNPLKLITQLFFTVPEVIRIPVSLTGTGCLIPERLFTLAGKHSHTMIQPPEFS